MKKWNNCFLSAGYGNILAAAQQGHSDGDLKLGRFIIRFTVLSSPLIKQVIPIREYTIAFMMLLRILNTIWENFQIIIV